MEAAKKMPLPDVILEYRKWKQQGEELRSQAKKAMESRFYDALIEAVQIAQEYRADFGVALKPPSPISAFRYKSNVKPKSRKDAKSNGEAKAADAAARAPQPSAKPDPKTAGLQKRLEAAKKKLEAARSSGAPTRTLEDRVYEIEDELRLATQVQ